MPAASCRPTAGTPPRWEARRYALKEAKEKRGAPSGERIRPRTAGVSAHEAIGLFNRFNGAVVAELRRNGLLAGKIDVASDFHNAKRHDKKPKPELIRGGDKKRETKAHETYAALRRVVAVLPYLPGRTRAKAVPGLLVMCAGHGVQTNRLAPDRGFTGVLSLLQEPGIVCTMPCPDTPHVRNVTESAHGRREKV